MSHSFHIPVLGLGFSIDTPLKVARFGISSVVSIVDDQLIERMRKYHFEQNNLAYEQISEKEHDFRAKRITAYLNLLNDLVNKQLDALKSQEFDAETELSRYFQLLPEHSPLKLYFTEMLEETDFVKKNRMQEELKNALIPGAIEVNIMSKVDKLNFSKSGEALTDTFTDALAALRGFALSNLDSSIILSAGMNPRLYAYLSEFGDFLPQQGKSKKKVILKVSDFRSAFIQAKFLAKKGIWVHEFRVESGLNCGGHAFATEGYLLGPILQEFKERRTEMVLELFSLYKATLSPSDSEIEIPMTRITVQGGIGNHAENNFLQHHYQLDGTGWGSPFLLVPEATNVDEETLVALTTAKHSDFYMSNASPLGIPFNDFKKSTSQVQRMARIAKGKPGSPCIKKFLISNTEFTDAPICTASRKYQQLKINELEAKQLPVAEYNREYERITEKACLCDGLTASVYLKYALLSKKESKAVAICPGPNTAYFKNTYSLEEMVKHIYGKVNLLEGVKRPNLFINELKLYVEYFRIKVSNALVETSVNQTKRLERFKEQLLKGIEYYRELLPTFKKEERMEAQGMENDLREMQALLKSILVPS